MEFAEHRSLLSSSLPSFFELLGQRSMTSVLRPALDHAVKVMAKHQPVYFHRLLPHSEELYTLVLLGLESYSLFQKGASFGEDFYGLHRQSLDARQRTLTRRHKLLSLLLLVIAPYIDSCCQRFAAQAHTRWKRLQRVLKLTLPYVRATWKGAEVAHYVMYLFDLTDVFSPALRLAGVRLVRRSPAMTADASSQKSSVLSRAFSFFGGVLLPSVVFFLSFLEWYYSSESGRQDQALPVPPAPCAPEACPASGLSVSSKHLCPICQQPFRIPTLLPVSGFVFCYQCLHAYISLHSRCPVTHLPATMDTAIRLFRD
eukprot:m.84290 g.84290  ORF g.84290 m.84290 type:complete len:314 (+) comp17781_c0_seq2:50-991(+)